MHQTSCYYLPTKKREKSKKDEVSQYKFSRLQIIQEEKQNKIYGTLSSTLGKKHQRNNNISNNNDDDDDDKGKKDAYPVKLGVVQSTTRSLSSSILKKGQFSHPDSRNCAVFIKIVWGDSNH